ISNSVLGLQNGLFRTKQLTGTASTDWDRDHLFASVFRSENLLIAQSTPGSGTSERAEGGNLNWSHDLSALTTTNLGFGFTHFEFSTINSEENLFSAIASIQYLFNASLKGWL